MFEKIHSEYEKDDSQKNGDYAYGTEVKKTIDTIRSEHLAEDIRPIVAAILSAVNMGSSKLLIEDIKNHGDFVDYDSNPRTLKKNNMRNAGENTYAISDCTPSPKWSRRYWNCTGVAVVGRDRQRNQEISILSHQDPWSFLEGKRAHDAFTRDLTQQIQKLLSQTDEGTVDAVIFGGHFQRPDEHKASIETVADVCISQMGFQPVVMTGPTLNENYPTEVYFDTQNRRLFIVRPDQPGDASSNLSYSPSDIEQKMKEWEMDDPRRRRRWGSEG